MRKQFKWSSQMFCLENKQPVIPKSMTESEVYLRVDNHSLLYLSIKLKGE